MLTEEHAAPGFFKLDIPFEKGLGGTFSHTLTPSATTCQTLWAGHSLFRPVSVAAVVARLNGDHMRKTGRLMVPWTQAV